MQPATEVLVVVNSDLEVGTQLTRLHVQVKNKAGDSTSTSAERNLALVPQVSKDAKATGPYQLPLSFSVVPPKNGDDSRFRIVVTGLLDDQDVVEQQEIVTFQPGKTTLLPVFLSVNCRERLCRDEQSAGNDVVCAAVSGLCDAVPTEKGLATVDPKTSAAAIAQRASVSPPSFPNAGVRSPAEAGAGGAVAGGDAGGGADSGTKSAASPATCVPAPERCNRLDDDCDGMIDEDALVTCQHLVVNADTDCVPLGTTAGCVLLVCHPGFADCDGDPTNGCEPFCTCHDCSNGSDRDAGR